MGSWQDLQSLTYISSCRVTIYSNQNQLVPSRIFMIILHTRAHFVTPVIMVAHRVHSSYYLPAFFTCITRYDISGKFKLYVFLKTFSFSLTVSHEYKMYFDNLSLWCQLSWNPVFFLVEISNDFDLYMIKAAPLSQIHLPRFSWVLVSWFLSVFCKWTYFRSCQIYLILSQTFSMNSPVFYDWRQNLRVLFND